VRKHPLFGSLYNNIGAAVFISKDYPLDFSIFEVVGYPTKATGETHLDVATCYFNVGGLLK